MTCVLCPAAVTLTPIAWRVGGLSKQRSSRVISHKYPTVQGTLIGVMVVESP